MSLGMKQICLTADMRLYKLPMQIMWSDPKRWSNLAMRTGGMCTLSSFLGLDWHYNWNYHLMTFSYFFGIGINLDMQNCNGENPCRSIAVNRSDK